jgi:protein-S-isoprenylcysteine O-methyltransferase Ste14
MVEIVLTIVIFIGYVGWGLMIFIDPIRIEIADYIAVPLGLAIGIPGLVLFVVSAKSKRGFNELDYLVTDGVYSKLRNPMYVGIMLIHVGFPIVAKGLLSLLSAIIWIPLILTWKYMEEKGLEKKFGEEYTEYKKRTTF